MERQECLTWQQLPSVQHTYLACCILFFSVSGNKYWSGLLRDYYEPRARIYFEYLLSSMQTGKSFPLPDWRRDWIHLTNSWQKSRQVYPTKATGNAYNISRWIFDKYLRGTGSCLRDEHSSSGAKCAV
jgi:Alpha-N-acetylglucosaminidase (NAGLU) C-terminal domain